MHNNARTFIYLIALVHVIAVCLSGVYALGAIKAIAPMHAENKAMLMATPGLFQPAVWTIMLGWLISCVDKD